jgi:hypothetical protein
LVGEVLIVGGLLLVQCVLSGYVVFTDHLLALGADPLAVIVVAGAAYAAFCLPFAVALERSMFLLLLPPPLSSVFRPSSLSSALLGRPSSIDVSPRRRSMNYCCL